MALADLDVDLKLEALAFASNGVVSLFQPAPDGTLGAPLPYLTGVSGTGFAIADLDGDQRLDIATAGSPGAVALYGACLP